MTLNRTGGFAVILAAGLLCYLHTLDYSRNCFDDFFYIGQPQLLTWSVPNLLYHLKTPVLKLHSPLVMYSFMNDQLLCPPVFFTAGCRLHNILYHILNAWLLWQLLEKLRPRQGVPESAGRRLTLLIALLWLWHPQRAESVIWIAERKDVMALALGLGTSLLWLRAADRGKITIAGTVLYLASFGIKPLLITLPALLMLLEFSRSGRAGLARSFRLTLPFWFIAAGYLAVNCAQVAAFTGQSAGFQTGGNYSRWEIAAVNCVRYWTTALWPHRITFLQPLYRREWPSFLYLLLTIVSGAALVRGAWSGRNSVREFCRRALPLWLAFFIALGPMCGLRLIGNVDYADRYSYFPAVWFSLLLLTAAAALYRRYGRPVLTVLTIAAAVMLAAGWSQTVCWRSQREYFERACDTPHPHPQALPLLAGCAWYEHDYDTVLGALQRQREECAGTGEEAHSQLLFAAAAALVRGEDAPDDPAVPAALDRIFIRENTALLCRYFNNIFNTALEKIGQYHLRRGTPADLRKAEEIYTIGTAMTDDEPLLQWKYRCNVHRLRGESAAAAACLREILAIDPADTQAAALLKMLETPPEKP